MSRLLQVVLWQRNSLILQNETWSFQTNPGILILRIPSNRSCVMTSKFCRALTAKQMAELLHQLPSYEPWHEVFFFRTMFHSSKIMRHTTQIQQREGNASTIGIAFNKQIICQVNMCLYTVNLFVFLYFKKLLVFFFAGLVSRDALRDLALGDRSCMPTLGSRGFVWSSWSRWSQWIQLPRFGHLTAESLREARLIMLTYCSIM